MEQEVWRIERKVERMAGQAEGGGNDLASPSNTQKDRKILGDSELFSYTVEHVNDSHSTSSLETLLYLSMLHSLFRQWLETRVILFR